MRLSSLFWNGKEMNTYSVTKKDLLSKAFEDMAKSVQVRTINECNSIIVTCYTPEYMMDTLLLTTKNNLDLLKKMGVTKFIISIFDTHQRDDVRDE